MSLITAPPGKTISGDEIADLIEENKKTGTPMAKLVKKLDENVTTMISPGPGVPEMKKRTPRRKNKNVS